MCGIVGYVGNREALPVLLEGLRRLEYRGYDSAGVAVLDDGRLERCRSAGKLERLDEALREKPIPGKVGIGHTRWATHGRPTEENAHPHTDCKGAIVVVHNGIIENFLELRDRLAARGHRFVTETDTETIAHLIEEEYRGDLARAVLAATKRLEGAYAVAVLSKDAPGKIVAAKKGPPLVIGLGDGEVLVASDVPALLPVTRRVIPLHDGEIAVLSVDGVHILDAAGRTIDREPETVPWDPVQAEKGEYKHFMLKEIYEQPLAVRDTIMGMVSHEEGNVVLPHAGLDEAAARAIRRVQLIACGTSWHAALAGRHAIESLSRLPVEVEVGSEFRYRDLFLEEGSLAVAITQSGETADTLAAIQAARERGARTLAVTNVPGSQVTRAADGVLFTHAGPEIGVAATKTFSTQIAALHLLALWLGAKRGVLTPDQIRDHAFELAALPYKMEQALAQGPAIEEVARAHYPKRNFLYLGRGPNFPIALEGALKLKEISYIHAEGYAAGEMKHGPIALIDREMPVVALLARDRVYEKMLGNIHEVKAREGTLIVVTSSDDPALASLADHVIRVPVTQDLLMPLVMVIPLQLLAYHIAVRRGCDVDQPRNLAKSVTVE